MDKISSLMTCWIVIAGVMLNVRGNHVGREFLIGFLEPYYSDNAKYFISITAQTTSTVIIASAAFNIVEVVVVMENTSANVDFSNSTFYHGDLEVTKETIVVLATGDISVSAYFYSSDASDGYLALPVQSLSNTYIAVSPEIVPVTSKRFPLMGKSTSGILIMSSADSNTVNISIKLPLGGSCGKGKHLDGASLQFLLQKYEIIGVQCTNDLTGTLVVSSVPVAVVSGSTLTDFPKGSKSSDRFMEMMIPVSAYGYNYVIHDLPGRASGTVFRLVASEATVVQASSGSVYKISAREYVDIDTFTHGQQCLSSSKPVLVVLFAKGSSDGKNTNIDMFMAVVPSVRNYATSYLINHNISTGILLSNYVTVIVPMDSAAGLRPNIISQLYVIEGCCFAVASVTPQTAVYMMENDAGIPFAVLSYGQSRSTAVGFPAGITFRQDGSPCGESGCVGTSPYPCSCVGSIPTYVCTDNSQGCNSSLCLNNGNCSATEHAYECQCMDGFGGAHCEADIVDDCVSNNCVHAHGTCIDAINSYLCNCSEGFTGQLCEQNLCSTCRSPDCLVPDSIIYRSSPCSWNIAECDLKQQTIYIDDCSGVICKNNGTCVDGTKSYSCQCLKSFTGIHCETGLDPCLSLPCQNNGSCYSSGNDTFVCVCNNDYIGDVCQYDLSDICVNNSLNFDFKSFNITEFNLTLDKRTLTQYIHRYVAYEDDRPSAKGLGYSGVMIIIGFMMCILLLDVDRLCRKPKKKKRKKRKKQAENAGPSDNIMPIPE